MSQAGQAREIQDFIMLPIMAYKLRTYELFIDLFISEISHLILSDCMGTIEAFWVI